MCLSYFYESVLIINLYDQARTNVVVINCDTVPLGIIFLQVIKIFNRNQKGVWMAVVNKVCKQVWTSLQLVPYIVTHNHFYISI